MGASDAIFIVRQMQEEDVVLSNCQGMFDLI